MTGSNQSVGKLSRRQFLRYSAATFGVAAAVQPAQRAQASAGGSSEDTPAILMDISRCTGCGNCQRSCIAANDLHPDSEQIGSLSAETYCFIDRVVLPDDRIRWVKRQCMHCLDAACASACPVAALHKTAEGPIGYHVDRCMGCRYCMVSCPFGVPRFDWEDALTPEITKCMFCIERQREGDQPACAANCSTGALKFGTRGALLREARSRINADPTHYIDHIYGEHEAGGTAMLYIADAPFDQLGFRTDVTTRPLPAYTWDIMSKLPAVIGSLAVVLTGASIFTKRRNGAHHDEPEWLHVDPADTGEQPTHSKEG